MTYPFPPFPLSYDTEEEEKARFAVFVENLAVIDRRNLEELHNGGSSVHGVTQFSDLSPSEFKARYLLSLPRKAEDIRPTTKHIKPLTDEVNVDWRGVYTTPVKNQVRFREAASVFQCPPATAPQAPRPVTRRPLPAPPLKHCAPGMWASPIPLFLSYLSFLWALPAARGTAEAAGRSRPLSRSRRTSGSRRGTR